MLTSMLAFGGRIGLPGLILLILVALLVFGKRIPELAKSLGKGIIEFKKGLKGEEETAAKPADQIESGSQASVNANATSKNHA